MLQEGGSSLFRKKSFLESLFLRVTRKGKLETEYTDHLYFWPHLCFSALSLGEEPRQRQFRSQYVQFLCLRVCSLFCIFLPLTRKIPARSSFWDTEIGLNLLGNSCEFSDCLARGMSYCQSVLPLRQQSQAQKEVSPQKSPTCNTLSQPSQLFPGSGFISYQVIFNAAGVQGEKISY